MSVTEAPISLEALLEIDKARIAKKLKKFDIEAMSKNEALSQNIIRRAYERNSDENKKRKESPEEKLAIRECQRIYSKWTKKEMTALEFRNKMRLIITNPIGRGDHDLAIKLLAKVYLR